MILCGDLRPGDLVVTSVIEKNVGVTNVVGMIISSNIHGDTMHVDVLWNSGIAHLKFITYAHCAMTLLSTVTLLSRAHK